MFWSMFVMLLILLPILLTAGAVMLYVAFPHRGQVVPRAPWLGEALQDAVDWFQGRIDPR